MFNLSGSEIIFLVLIALVVLGPDKLPEAMRKAGKAYADFKKMTGAFQHEMRSVLDEPLRELRETADLAKQSAMWDVNGSTTSTPTTSAAQNPAPGTTESANHEKPVSGSMAAFEPAVAGQPVAESPPAAADEPAAAPAESTPASTVVSDPTSNGSPSEVASASDPDDEVASA